jgi:hypothetical protein
MGIITLINKSGFIKGRFIWESVVTAHEILHYVVHDKKEGLVLKIDYEKAFDKVNVDFLLDILKKEVYVQDLSLELKLLLQMALLESSLIMSLRIISLLAKALGREILSHLFFSIW